MFLEMGKPELTRDFMAVDSFSQLPFIRSPPQKSSSPSSAVRLFGIDLPHDDDTNSTTSPKESSTTPTAAATTVAPADPVRRFECHYCCRNFPTSQALGGHQNAHKRERQHAKQAHLRPALAPHHHYQYQVHPAAAHAAPPPSHHYYYPSTAAAPPRLGLGSPSQPITGSPLPGLWRVPHALIHCDRTGPLVQPVFRDGGGIFSNFSAVPSPSSSSTNMSMSSRLACDPGAARCVTENVSLDLHL